MGVMEVSASSGVRSLSDLRPRKLSLSILLIIGLLLALPEPAAAQGIDGAPEQFLAQAFGGREPQALSLWLTDERQRRAAQILTHPLGALRVRYWRLGSTTAWILDEIGKTEPITIGVAIRDGAIAQIQVLAFRESRGDEIRHGFFTNQFVGAGLRPAAGELDRTIDGITGATLSVRAMRRVARLALYFHALVAGDEAPINP